MKTFIACLAMVLLLAAGFVLLSLSHHAAAQTPACANVLNDDALDDGVVNDGCPQVGALAESGTQCANAVDDDDSINDGCAQVGARKDCDTDVTPDGDCTDPGEAALCENNTSDDGADDAVVNDGCPQLGARLDCDTDPTPDGDCTDPGEPALCTNAVSDDPADDALGGFVNDGCPRVGQIGEFGPIGGLAELPDVANDSAWSAGTYAGLAGGLAAAVVVLGAGAWYARRRWAR